MTLRKAHVPLSQFVGHTSAVTGLRKGIARFVIVATSSLGSSGDL
jgi:hypothetical protein